MRVCFENIQHILLSCLAALATSQHVMPQYPDIFDGKLGRLPGTVHLEIDGTAQPIRLPVHQIHSCTTATALQRLKVAGILAQVNQPTNWVFVILVVKKPNGSLRICVDPKQLNAALKRPHYSTAIIDELLPQLSHVKVFSVCNVQNGFRHLALDTDNSLLTTFGTP